MHSASGSHHEELIQQLNVLRSEMLSLEASGLISAVEEHAPHCASARNLVHYLALRRHDIRQWQSKLASLGLSSLVRGEAHVLSSLNAVISVLHRLKGNAESAPVLEGTQELGDSPGLLEKNAEALLGTPPVGPKVRIMVTMPPEAATNYEVVRDLLVQGMDCMRINCAHDGSDAWSSMIQNLRRAEKETNKRCKVAMDLAGPKLHTGSMEPGPAVLKYRPLRDPCGHVTSPARIWLTPDVSPEVAPEPADAVVPVPQPWLARLKLRDRIRFTDARGASRLMSVSGANGNSRWAEAVRTAYVFEGMILVARGRRARVGPIPVRKQTLRLKLGDTLILTKSLEPGRVAQRDSKNNVIVPGRIGVSLPEFFEGVRSGEPIWLDDGKIGGVIRSVSPERVSVEITQARPSGEKLGAEKGINVPESQLHLSSLTKDDLEGLPFRRAADDPDADHPRHRHQ